nr:AraC family transcriptional regulator [Agrobacterium larrymoorei]
MEAFFAGRGYEMHRHDTYAIGCTLSGVQSFQYRGAVRNSLPGGTIVLHPDEPHDGQAGTDDGFHYRIAYVEPAAIQSILGGRPLPYIQGGISEDRRLLSAARRILREVDDPIETFEYEDALFELANALAAAANPHTLGRRKQVDYSSAEMARQYLAERPQTVTLEQIETICGRDRWSLSRDFRALFGTSPYRYLTMRRLDAVKTSLRNGSGLADAAFSAGFADQSHMTRQFLKAFGVSPGRWLTLTREPR